MVLSFTKERGTPPPRGRKIPRGLIKHLKRFETSTITLISTGVELMQRLLIQPDELQVPPGLAATGFQEMRPVSTLDDASKGDGIPAINRADSASVKRCSFSVRAGISNA